MCVLCQFPDLPKRDKLVGLLVVFLSQHTWHMVWRGFSTCLCSEMWILSLVWQKTTNGSTSAAKWLQRTSHVCNHRWLNSNLWPLSHVTPLSLPRFLSASSLPPSNEQWQMPKSNPKRQVMSCHHIIRMASSSKTIDKYSHNWIFCFFLFIHAGFTPLNATFSICMDMALQ